MVHLKVKAVHLKCVSSAIFTVRFYCFSNVSSGAATRSTVLRREIMDKMRETVGFTINLVYFQMVKKELLTDHVQLKIKKIKQS